ncbi:MAG: hypothetical protein JWN47_3407 [Frankiales bacterium]|nr:hypothetical protein [Frankiales bacterium]
MPNQPETSIRGSGIPNEQRLWRVDWIVLAVVLMFVSASTLTWDWLWRRNQPYDIDESGYLAISLADFHAFIHGGLTGWVHQVEAPSNQSPLTTALATPLYLAFGDAPARPLVALVVPLLFTLITIAVTFALARRVGSRSTAWTATVLTASAPVVINYSRDYHFAAAATAVTMLALYCLVRTGGLLSWRWSLAFGLSLGLMPLARTMTVAYIPGLLLAAAVIVLVNRSKWKLRLFNAISAALVGSGTALIWLGVNGNGRLVWDYLTAYGYGSASAEYGTSHPLFSYAGWRTTIQSLGEFVYLPHLIFFLLGATAGLLAVIRLLAHSPRRGLQRVAHSPLLPSVLLVAVGLTALTSSANQGSAFSAPLVPPMCIVSACTLALVFRSAPKPVRRLPSIAAVVVAVIATVPSLPVAGPLSGTWRVVLPQLGPVAVSSGQGAVQQYEQSASAAGTHRVAGAKASGQQWVVANQYAAARLGAPYGNSAVIAFGFRHRLLNVNSVNLQRQITDSPPLPLMMVPRQSTGDTVAGYQGWLTTGEAARACLLVTASGDHDEFVPLVSGPNVEAAAGAVGFTRVATWPLPDGRQITEWQRSRTCPRPPGSP